MKRQSIFTASMTWVLVATSLSLSCGEGGSDEVATGNGAAPSGAGMSSGGAGGAGGAGGTDAQSRPPNFILITADDLGYGDLSSYGSASIDTPNLDRLADGGQLWTDFYAPAAVCTPSRAGLLTGRFPIRTGVYPTESSGQVFFDGTTEGLPAYEITIGEALQELGYVTGMFGKWHLGELPQFYPSQHGFDEWFGFWTGYSIYENDQQLEPGSESNVEHFTRRFTEKAIDFVHRHREEQFFVYLPYFAPHVPLHPGAEFANTSDAGAYGDTVEELDHYIGRLVQALEDEGIAENTLIVFTSDNGPWIAKGPDGGSAAPFSGGKFETSEGGWRVPGIFSWPGRITPGVVNGMGSGLDLLQTFVTLAGGTPPSDRTLDGYDLSATLLGTGESPRDHLYYFYNDRIDAYRSGHYKISMTPDKSWYWLYDLSASPIESFEEPNTDVRSANPEVAERMLAEVQAFDAELERPPSLIEIGNE